MISIINKWCGFQEEIFPFFFICIGMEAKRRQEELNNNLQTRINYEIGQVSILINNDTFFEHLCCLCVFHIEIWVVYLKLNISASSKRDFTWLKQQRQQKFRCFLNQQSAQSCGFIYFCFSRYFNFSIFFFLYHTKTYYNPLEQPKQKSQ